MKKIEKQIPNRGEWGWGIGEASAKKCFHEGMVAGVGIRDNGQNGDSGLGMNDGLDHCNEILRLSCATLRMTFGGVGRVKRDCGLRRNDGYGRVSPAGTRGEGMDSRARGNGGGVGGIGGDDGVWACGEGTGGSRAARTGGVVEVWRYLGARFLDCAALRSEVYMSGNSLTDRRDLEEPNWRRRCETTARTGP